MAEGQDGYWVPECVRAYLRAAGYSTRALEDMEPHVREWDRWMRAVGEFYDYRDTDGFGRVYQVHRKTIMPAMRVCREWGSLLLDEKTVVACESRECTNWLSSFFSSTNLCFVNLSFHKTASVRFTRQREDSSRTSVALAPILSSPTTPRA